MPLLQCSPMEAQREFLPTEAQPAGHLGGQADERSGERRLPGSALTHQREALTAVDAEGDAVHHLAAVVTDPDLLGFEYRRPGRQGRLRAHGEWAALGSDVGREPACGLVPRPHVNVRGEILPAAVRCLRASVSERATGRPIADARSHSGNRLKFQSRPNVGCCRHEGARVRMRRPVEHALHGPLFHDATRVHDDHAVGEILDDSEVMGDVEHGDVVLAGKPAHGRKDSCLSRDIQAGRRLIKDHTCGLARECHGDAHPLSLTA